jgi:hypothetical protein
MVMERTAKELQEIISSYCEKLKTINATEFNAKPNPKKWSKKEVLGHLIDSAHNNLRRFIVGQYESAPHIVYDQDFWVSANDYQHMADADVIELWRLVNERIIALLKIMPSDHYDRTCNTGKGITSIHSLQWLAEDYLKHMMHHLNHIIPESFNVTYPS